MSLKIKTNLRPGAAWALRSGFRSLLAAATLCAAAAAPEAQEADPADRWTGPYAGLTLGALGAGAELSRGAGLSDLSVEAASPVLGVVAGWDWAVWDRGTGVMTLGVEAEANLFSADRRRSDATLGDVRLDGNALGAVRMRAGWAWEETRIFAAAGLAVTDLAVKTDGRGDGASLGLTLGVGAEYAVTETWTARGEAALYGFGEDERSVGGAARDVNVGASVLRIGVTRKF